MRAKAVNEIQQFERGVDPKDSMGIGNSEIRKINSSLKFLQSIVSSAYSVEELNFQETVDYIDNLKEMITLIIQTYLKKKYGWDFKRSDSGALSGEIGDGYELKLSPSNSGRSFKMALYKNDYIGSMSESVTLKTMDKKIQVIVKKYLKK